MKQIAATAGEFVISFAIIYSDHTMEPSKEFNRALNKFAKWVTSVIFALGNILTGWLRRKLNTIAEECNKLSRLNPFWRYLQQSEDSGNLQAIRTRLNHAIELFQVC